MHDEEERQCWNQNGKMIRKSEGLLETYESRWYSPYFHVEYLGHAHIHPCRFSCLQLNTIKDKQIGWSKTKNKKREGGLGICRHPSLYMYVCVSSASSPMNAIYVRKMIKWLDSLFT